MRISEDELARRVNSPRNLLAVLPSPVPAPAQNISSGPISSGPTQTENQIRHEKIDRAYRKGSPNVPEFLRDTIGSIARQPGAPSQSHIGRIFDVSNNAVSDYKTGKVGGRPAREDRAEKVATHELKIKDTALLKLMKSLELITDDKLEDLDAKELSNVASSMGKVVSSLRENGNGQSPVTVVLYSPESRSEKSYRVVDI